MRFWPDTLKSRAILILCSVFVLSHAVNLLIYEANRERTILLTEATDLAARIVGIADLALALPEADRGRVLSAAETQFLATLPSPDTAGDGACQNNDFAQVMQDIISRDLVEGPGFGVDVCVRNLTRLAHLLPYNQGGGFDVLVNLTFPDGEDALFHAVLPLGPSLMNDLAIFYLVFTGLMALIIAGYLIWRVVTPLERLAQAADELGLNIEARALEETGPREVRSASRAFNRMQGRIQQLLNSQVEMISAISHDLRSAVTRLQLRAEMLDASEDRRGMLRVVGDMRQMVEAMIQFMRGINPSEPLQTIRVDELVANLCQDLQTEGSPVSCHLAGPPCHMPCRPTSLRRAIQNIIDNAIKYGTCAEVQVESSARRLIVKVQDQGPGVEEQHLENVLTPFFRLEPSRNEATGGVGLGLTIAHNIIRAHGGSLRLSNSLQGGLLVRIELPAP